MKVIDIPIEQIHVGDRRRKDYGDIGALAKGIKRVGLLEPIIVDHNGKRDSYRLVAGERRLKAAQMLKWKTIPAQLLVQLSEAELRDIELEENENRKDLTEQERNRTFRSSDRLIEHAKKVGAVSPQSAGKPQGGRPSKYGKPKPEVAADLGISEDTLERAEHHVETAEQFPFMRGNEWHQSDVLAVREQLEKIPAAEQEAVAGVLACAKLMDPKSAKTIVANLADMPQAERDEIYALSRSEDPRDRSLALSRGDRKPPMPDPRLRLIEDAMAALRKAIKPYPNDPLTPQIQDELQRLKSLWESVKAVSFDARRSKGEMVQ